MVSRERLIGRERIYIVMLPPRDEFPVWSAALHGTHGSARLPPRADALPVRHWPMAGLPWTGKDEPARAARHHVPLSHTRLVFLTNLSSSAHDVDDRAIPDEYARMTHDCFPEMRFQGHSAHTSTFIPELSDHGAMNLI